MLPPTERAIKACGPGYNSLVGKLVININLVEAATMANPPPRNMKLCKGITRFYHLQSSDFLSQQEENGSPHLVDVLLLSLGPSLPRIRTVQESSESQRSRRYRQSEQTAFLLQRLVVHLTDRRDDGMASEGKERSERRL